MITRTTAAVAAALLALALTACTPEPTPTPTPTPTGFSSEDEAFAAAEATYRAYIDAVNARRADPSSVDPNEYLSGTALNDSIEAARKLDAAGLQVVGPALVESIKREEASTSSAVIAACIDSTQTRVLDQSGADVTPTDRPETLALQVEVAFSVPHALIIRSEAAGAGEC